VAEAPTVFSDRYEMVRHIARGGMAQVYLAQDLLLDRPVALKVLFPELSVDHSFVERFRREAKAAANLSHPNIVSVYDWGQGENTYFIVMEYVDGPTLSSMLRDGPLAPERAAVIAAAVAAALDFAHRRGVIHRDVKPGNVLIDQRNQVKVADFGIARAVGTSENLTQTGSVMGTATYFSPEQAQGYAVDPRSDVYSLGVVLYEMVTGQAPFSGDSPVAIAYKHVKEPVPLPRQINPAVPPALESVILKAMAKDPADRYQSAEEMRADLARFASGEAVTAPAALAATGVMGAVGVGAATQVETVVRDGAPPPRSSRAAWYVLIALLLLALLIGGYFLGRSAGLFGTKTQKVPPGLVGQPVANDQSELSALGFTDVRTAQAHSGTVPVGIVMSTNPGANTRMALNAPLTLTVSSGRVQVQVPGVAGQTQAAANTALSAVNLVPQFVRQNSATVQSGLVISTTPPAGTSVPTKSQVTVYVSSGVQQVAVPPVSNENQAAAGATLAKAGLSVGQTTPETSTSVQPGYVIGTSPAPGTMVSVGTSVNLIVSSGPPTTTTVASTSVPDLSGDNQQQAAAALQAQNLVGQFTPVPVTDKKQNGQVQSQSPAPNTSVPQGSTVQVTIGQYSPPSATTTTTTTTTGPPGP
jgi:beta-lactam-binding protein with PASTA domain/tRNA A-37 threonylcarbamoyl transferase component Bud32